MIHTKTVARAALLIALVASAAHAAPVKGKLVGGNPASYKLVSIAPSGKSAVAAIGGDGRFSVTATGGASLHLLRSNGQYFGPVVLPKGKGKAYTSLKGKGGDLGRLSVKGGFITASSMATGLYAVRKPVSFDKSSGTRGSRNLGLGTGTQRRRPFLVAAVPGSDDDLDGVPAVLDIDDDGDGILDVVDPIEVTGAPLEAEISSTLRLPLADSINLTAATVTQTELDAAVKEHLRLGLFIRNNEFSSASVSAVNIDCSGLPYCTAQSGTAIISGPQNGSGYSRGDRWTQYDPDGDGLPNLALLDASGKFPAEIVIHPRSTTAEIRPGDTLLFQIKGSAGVSTLPALVPFYFLTVPAVREVSAGGRTSTVSYPSSSRAPGSSLTNPITVADTTLTFTFWRPQRPALPSESGSYRDTGGLKYGVLLTFPGSISDAVVRCDPADYSSPSSTLQLVGSSASDQMYRDTSRDSETGSSVPLSFTLDLKACVRRAGLSEVGALVQVDLVATSENADQASQQVWYQLP